MPRVYIAVKTGRAFSASCTVIYRPQVLSDPIFIFVTKHRSRSYSRSQNLRSNMLEDVETDFQACCIRYEVSLFRRYRQSPAARPQFSDDASLSIVL